MENTKLKLKVRVKQMNRRSRLEGLSRLKEILVRENMTLGDVRRLLLPSDPWEAVRGIWKDKKAGMINVQKRLRKEWDRD